MSLTLNTSLGAFSRKGTMWERRVRLGEEVPQAVPVS